MKKNMRYWALGIILLFILLLITIFTAVNRFNARKSDRSGTSLSSVQMAFSTVSVTNLNLDNVSVEDNVNRYLSRQDEIMTDMIQAMKSISPSGNASIDFLKGMISHHESAIFLSETYLSYGGSNEKLKNLAENIILSRQEEITRMQDLAVKYETEDHNSEDKESAYLEDYYDLLGQDRNVGTSSRASLDQAFSDGLTDHHQMAVEMAKSILDYTDYEEIRTLAQSIITIEEQEINEMHDYNQ